MANVPRTQWAVTHRLDRIDVSLSVSEEDVWRLVVTGHATTKRDRLWRLEEVFPADQGTLSISDWVAHICQVATADRPRSLEALNGGLRGGWSEGDALPL